MKRLQQPNRRQFLKAGGVSTVVATAGCLGSNNGGSTTQPDTDDSNSAWTTQQLKEKIAGDETITIYAGTGEGSQWKDLTSVINDEFGTSLSVNVFAGNGREVSQRFIQERQANSDKVDILNNASNLTDKITTAWREEGKDKALEQAAQWFEMGVDENFWFKDVLGDWHLLPFMIPAINGGSNATLPYNKRIFEENGVEPPKPYNELLDDKYEGMTMLIPGYIGTNAGFYIERAAKDAGMDPMDWLDELRNNVNFEGASGPTTAVRRVANGDAAMVLFTWPNVVQSFLAKGKDELGGSFPEGGYWPAGAGPFHINKEAPNPWVARFFASATLEAPVQKRILSDVYTQTPVRLELDYSDVEASDYDKQVMGLGDTATKVGYTEIPEYRNVINQAREEGKFQTS